LCGGGCGELINTAHTHCSVACAAAAREAFEAGYLAREQSMARHDLGICPSDQVERDQACHRWQEQRQAAGAPDLSWVDELLRGIDKDQCEDDTGWWETSTGAELGKSVLADLKREITRRYHEIGAAKGGAG
jgi:hypothetical protein